MYLFRLTHLPFWLTLLKFFLSVLSKLAYKFHIKFEIFSGMLVTCPGMKPGAIRVDQLDREQEDEKVIKYPEIVHFGTRPQQLCYAGNAEYQKVWREYIKSRHLLANMPKPTFKDKRNIETMEEKLNEMRANIKMKREVAVAVSSQGFYKTGLRTDIVQHGK